MLCRVGCVFINISDSAWSINDAFKRLCVWAKNPIPLISISIRYKREVLSVSEAWHEFKFGDIHIQLNAIDAGQ